MSPLKLYKLKRRPDVETVKKKKSDRFDGMTEEEIIEKYTLSDYLEKNLDIVFVGINPSLTAAYKGKYYAGPGNHFYKLLHESRLTPKFVGYEQDYTLLQYGIGLTNVVSRPSRTSADIKKSEIKEGVKTVQEKLIYYQPRVAVFNGKCIYEVFANKTGKSINFGLQPERIGNSALWVVPSSSARCSQFPRMADKLEFFTTLKKWLELSKGQLDETVNEKDFILEGKQRPATTSIMWRRKPKSSFLCGGTICNKQKSRTNDFEEFEQPLAHDNKENSEDESKTEQSDKPPQRNITKKKSRGKSKIGNSVPKWKPINKVDPQEFVALIKQRAAEKANKSSDPVEENEPSKD